MAHMEKIKITAIIPTLNGGETFRRLLAQLAVQTLAIDELLVVDSSSDDNTVSIAQEFGATVISVARVDFDHGSTRTMAAKESSGDYLLYFTQDAVPENNRVIEMLLAPLLQDKKIALSYGRQLANHDASLFAKTLRLFNYPKKSEIRCFADRKQKGLKTVFASNSCAAYRKNTLSEVGFFAEGLIFGEDTCVAGKLLAAGYTMAYVAEATVFHSHNYSITEEFHRSFDIGVLHHSESWLLTTYGKAEGEGIKYVQFELSTILSKCKYQLIPVFFCRNLAKFSGYKLGSMYYALPQWLVPKLSMNKTWWSRQV
jgi:polysaccharide biosynthesis protein PslC